MLETVEYYYRANSKLVFTEVCFGIQAAVHFEKYSVEKKTPKGVWIRRMYESGGTHKEGTAFLGAARHFVRNEARKKFAYPTKKEALLCYKMRTGRYIQILEARLQHAKAGYEAAIEERMFEGDD